MPHTLARARLVELLDAAPRCRIAVVGDAMLDIYLHGDVDRISPEAPVPVVRVKERRWALGGAANVANNVRALGARCELVAAVGSDAGGRQLRDMLAAIEAESESVIDVGRPTTTKTRIVTTRNQQVARVDYESDDAPSSVIEDAVNDQIASRAEGAAVIIVSDYLKGIVTRRVMAATVAKAQELGVPVLVDPKIPHLDFYNGATFVTPNHHEAEAATHMRIRSDEDAKRAAQMFRERARCDGVLITRGEHGMWLACEGIEGHLPATAREVADVTGREVHCRRATPPPAGPAWKARKPSSGEASCHSAGRRS